MISDISGSDIAEKVGWNDDTMLVLFNEFITRYGHEDAWLEFLNSRADSEMKESENPWQDWLDSNTNNDIILGC